MLQPLSSVATIALCAHSCVCHACVMRPCESCCPAVQVAGEEVGDPLDALLAGRVHVVEFSGGRVFVDAPRGGRLYLPGSFNPIHDGHRCVPGGTFKLVVMLEWRG